jgi:uncharacterized protein YjbJ (UPF0337 family)
VLDALLGAGHPTAARGRGDREERQPEQEYWHMDKDRIEGTAKQAKGAIKGAVGKVVGDAKLQADGKADQVEGKVQNAVGGLKDTLRKAWTG